MLVHIKIKRSPRNQFSLKNRINSQDDPCLLTRPIHCKKNQSTSKVKKLLTQRVSMYGSNFKSQSGLSYDNIQSHPNHKTERDNQLTQQKKREKKQNNMTLELSTLYKKSFKYNTTVHQIIKNFSKHNNCKIKSHLYNKNCKTEGISLSYEYDKQKQQFKSVQKLAKEKNVPCLEKLENLEKINDDYRLLYNNFDGSSRSKCHINQIEFEGKPIIMASSSYQWKTNHAQLPFSKSNWIHNSKLKKKLKQNILIQQKFNLMLENSDNFHDGLIAIEQNPQTNSNSVSLINGSHYEDLCKSNRLQNKQRLKDYNVILKTQEAQTVTGRESFREVVTKNRKKYSMDLRQTHHFQFSVEAWNTKQKQEYQPQLPIGQYKS